MNTKLTNNVAELEEITPYENYTSAIRDKATKNHYQGQLEMFLDPNYPWGISPQKKRRLSEPKMAKLVNDFIIKFKQDPQSCKNKIKRYAMNLKNQIDEKKLNGNTAPNRLKPIKVMLKANEIDFSWYLIDKMMPKETKSADRAYTRKEIQDMMPHCGDIIDKLIITMYSACGFRLEAWDYFTWEDIIFFKDDNGNYKGCAILVYRGYSEAYWTHGTPEVCETLEIYKKYWISRFHTEPKKTDPLLIQEKKPFPRRLNHRGVIKRVKRVVEKIGIRTKKVPGTNRFEVKLDHGFRKYFNTMMRRAKVYWPDKEDMMGHKVKLESSYERYEESDFERFPEYQKAIPFLTIDESLRQKLKVKQMAEQNTELEIAVRDKKELEKSVEAMQKERDHEQRTQKRNEIFSKQLKKQMDQQSKQSEEQMKIIQQLKEEVEKLKSKK